MATEGSFQESTKTKVTKPKKFNVIMINIILEFIGSEVHR